MPKKKPTKSAAGAALGGSDEAKEALNKAFDTLLTAFHAARKELIRVENFIENSTSASASTLASNRAKKARK